MRQTARDSQVNWPAVAALCLLLAGGLCACKKQPDPILQPVLPASLNQVSTVVAVRPETVGYKDGPLNQAQFRGINGIAFDVADNLYIADYNNNRIRKITPDGIVSTYAGTGEYDLKDGSATQAAFAGPYSLIFDKAGSLYVTQAGAVRKITPDGIVSTLNGVKPTQLGRIGIDSLLLFNSYGLTFDLNNNLYVSSNYAQFNRIVKIEPSGKASLFAGVPNPGQTRPLKDQVPMAGTSGVGYDAIRNLFYITDVSYGIYKALPDGTTSNFINYNGYKDGPVNVARFNLPFSPVFDKAGNLYLGDGQYIRKITPDGIVSTVAGSNEQGKQDGRGDKATFSSVLSLAFNSKGELYVSDNSSIRKVVLGAQ